MSLSEEKSFSFVSGRIYSLACIEKESKEGKMKALAAKWHGIIIIIMLGSSSGGGESNDV
jgi:hypothetical protein